MRVTSRQQCVDYAQRVGLVVVFVNPADLHVVHASGKFSGHVTLQPHAAAEAAVQLAAFKGVRGVK
jgi:hypothetical protein